MTIWKRLGKIVGAALLSGAILIPVAVVLAQGQFTAKPFKLPGKIAFLRDQNVWLMNADGSGQKLWKPMGNAIGRLSWSPDAKRVAFSRQGDYTYSLPDGGGGVRKLYDVFASHVDSTREAFWWWITLDHGSRSPEWSRDGKYIVYARDMNANLVDAEIPDYQIEYRTFDGSEVVRLTRKDAKPGECQGLDPTWSPDGKRIAFIYQKRKAKIGENTPGAPSDPIGLVVVPATGITIPETDLEAQARRVPNASGPVWSPDGQWIAFVSTQTEDNGIYLIAPDGANKKRIFEKTERLVPVKGAVSWSGDSQWIAFSSTDGYIYVIDRDGAQKPQRITSGGNDYMPAFSPK